MSMLSRPNDPLFTSLDSLVRDKTISGEQAERVYSTVTASGSGAAPGSQPAASEVQHPFDIPRLVIALGIFAAAIGTSGFVVAAGLASTRDFEWKTFLVMLAITVAFAAGAFVNLTLTKGDVASHVLTGTLATLAALGLGITVVSPWDATALSTWLAS